MYGRDCGYNEELRLSFSCQCEDPLKDNTRPECSRTTPMIHFSQVSLLQLKTLQNVLIYFMNFGLGCHTHSAN